jgi:hypothetical protein
MDIRPRSVRIMRTIAWIIAGLLLLAVGAAVLLVQSHRERSAWVANRGCLERLWPSNPDSDIADPRYHPYGKILSCKVVDRKVPWFGDVYASTVALLESDKGPVVIEFDYGDPRGGTQSTVTVFELTPEQAPSTLTADEAKRHREAVDSRSGVRPEVWTYAPEGDG